MKSQPLKSSLEVIGAQVKLEAASIGPATTAPSLPGCSVRSLLQDMGLQVHLSPLPLPVMIHAAGSDPPSLCDHCVRQTFPCWTLWASQMEKGCCAMFSHVHGVPLCGDCVLNAVNCLTGITQGCHSLCCAMSCMHLSSICCGFAGVRAQV